VITDGERYNKVVDIWAEVADKVAKEMMEQVGKEDVIDPVTGKVERMPSFNPIYMMADSGARGSAQQIRQLAGMRGLMAKPSGEIIETPITANFREGLSVLQYFISTHGARKGLADTALKTANSGYLTRRLVDVAQDATSRVRLRHPRRHRRSPSSKRAATSSSRSGDRILGRIALYPVLDPVTGEVLVQERRAVRRGGRARIEQAGIEEVVIRSVLTCATRRGICAACYGRDLARGYMVNIGEAVGIIAAQSIGEPGTQLTMRTFHIGGTARQGRGEHPHQPLRGPRALDKMETVARKDGKLVVMNRHGELVIVDATGRERERTTCLRRELPVKDGDLVKPGTLLATWDPHSVPILTEVAGVMKLRRPARERDDRGEGRRGHGPLAQDGHRGTATPRCARASRSVDPHTTTSASRRTASRGATSCPAGCNITVQDGERGGRLIIAKMTREAAKTKDITGGLPRVAELFEARKPKDAAVISPIDGYVKFGRETKGKRQIFIVPKGQEAFLNLSLEEEKKGKKKKAAAAPPPSRAGKVEEFLVPKSKLLVVREGEYVKRRRPAHRRAGEPPRHPAGEGREGAVGLAGERDPAGVPAPGRGHQRQAHRDHRAADAAPRARGHGGRDGLPRRRAGGEVALRAGEPQGRQQDAQQDPRRGQGQEPQVADAIRAALKASAADMLSVLNDRLAEVGVGTRPTAPSAGDRRTVNTAVHESFAVAEPLLLGITKASLSTDSFISASSFQETTKVLTEAAILGKTDDLRGLKENVIMGRLIPAGTGLGAYKKLEVVVEDEHATDMRGGRAARAHHHG
jgi:hypothetical protein